MADINYSKVGWDTTKYVNPTNMNQMDNGIKAACDGVDTLTNNLAQKAEIAKTTEKITTTVPAKGYDVYEISNQKNGYTPISCIPYGISLAIQCNISYYNNKFFVSLSNSYNYAINIDNNVEIYWIKNN